MSLWGDAILFGFALVAFVLGMTSIIMGFMPQPEAGLKEKIEYGFFGVTGLVGCLLLAIAI
ncbi:hypothetical protein [Aestuariibacter salexigens]|uniref:hypothetical protein n=1 Tax=Aestuariibacter salexigens TaxID=226010 RepID=UPI0004076AAD|nr:hypothetical protein [Aestuariibacter salexigens]